MSHKTQGAVAAVLWLLREQPPGNFLQAIAGLTTVFVFAVFAVPGALILSHRPRHTVGRLMMLEGTIRKTLLYTALTMLLGLVYFGSIILRKELDHVVHAVECLKSALGKG